MKIKNLGFGTWNFARLPLHSCLPATTVVAGGRAGILTI